MAVPLLTKKIVKKRVKQFKRPQSDRKISVKVVSLPKFVHTLLLFLSNFNVCVCYSGLNF